MIWKVPMVKIGPVLVQDDPKFIDDLTWRIAYKRGYIEPRFTMPALITEFDVVPFHDGNYGVLIWHGNEIKHMEYVRATSSD